HQAPLLLELLLVFHRAGRRKPPVDGPDEKDGVPLLALRAVRGAEHERRLVLLNGCIGEVLRTLRRLERERGEKRVATRIAGGDVAQLIEIGEPWLGSIVPLPENRIVEAA